MPLDRFLIAPEREGLVNNVLPWLISDLAFAEQNNCYTWRERIKKRFGTQWLQNTTDPQKSRLRVQLAAINGGGTGAGTVPGIIWKIGQQFSVGATLLTVYQANGAMLTTGAVTGTFNTASGAYTLAMATPATIPYFYPTEPGMGTYNYEVSEANLSPTLAFDTQFSYIYDLTDMAFKRLNTEAVAGDSLWTGTNDQFFWGITWRNTNTTNTADNVNIFFVVNDKDPIRYLEGATWTGYKPLLNILPGPTNVFLESAKIVVAYKGRLVFLNTLEGATKQRFPNRARISWTQSILGNVVDPQGASIPAINNAFFEASGKGSYLDAPTSEAIVSAGFVRDRLIVEFEESTFQLAYTGAPDLPFVWQKIDNNFGATSTLGQVSFDNFVIGFGKNAIVSCNGASVQRIDSKIPQAVFQIRGSLEQFQRVSGIRDYFEENIYWTFPDSSNGSDFPSKVLVYDYVNGNWSFNDDSFTVFGYHYQQFGLTWATWTTPWNESTWQWNEGENVRSFKSVIAINQQGYVVQIENDLPINAPALSVANMNGTLITARNHNLSDSEFIKITGAIGSTNLNGRIIQVNRVLTADTFTITEPADNGYLGGGVIARVSRISLKTKEFNFYTKTGQTSYIPYCEFLVNNLGRGQNNLPAPVPPPYDPLYDPDLNRPRIKVDYFVSSSVNAMVQQGNASGASYGVSGGNILDMFPYDLLPIEESQERFWKRVYFQAQGETIQMRIYYNDDMMRNPNQSLMGFMLHAILVYATPKGTRFNG